MFSFLKVSSSGEIFQQAFTTSSPDDIRDKTCIPGPGSGDVILSRESQIICKNWMDKALSKVRKRGMSSKGRKIGAEVSRWEILAGECSGFCLVKYVNIIPISVTYKVLPRSYAT